MENNNKSPQGLRISRIFVSLLIVLLISTYLVTNARAWVGQRPGGNTYDIATILGLTGSNADNGEGIYLCNGILDPACNVATVDNWFRFVLPAATTVSFRVDYDGDLPTGDYDALSLYSSDYVPDGVYLGSNEAGCPGIIFTNYACDQLENQNLAAGHLYYLKVKVPSGSKAWITWTYDGSSSSSALTWPVVVSYRNIHIVGEPIHGYMPSNQSTHWYKLQTCLGETGSGCVSDNSYGSNGAGMELSLTMADTLNLNIYVYDSANLTTPIASVSSSATTKYIEAAPPSGLAYIKVVRSGSGSGEYTLDVNQYCYTVDLASNPAIGGTTSLSLLSGRGLCTSSPSLVTIYRHSNLQLNADPSPGWALVNWTTLYGNVGDLIRNTSAVANFINLPTQVSAITASKGDYADRVFIAWNTSPAADYYQLFRNTTNSIPASPYQNNLPSPQTNDYDAFPGATYYYWVTACNSGGCSNPSPGDTGWRKLAPPASVQATNNLTDKIRITWTGSSNDNGYDIWRGTTTSFGSAQKINSSNITYPTTYYDDPASVGVTYYYWVTAYNNYTTSSPSNYDDGFRIQSNNPPYTPNTPNPSQNATNIPITQTLYWNGGDPDSGNTVTYTVYWKLSTSGTYTQACANTSATSCDPSGDFGYSTTYNWYVVASDNLGATSQNTPWTFATGSTPNNPPYTPNTPNPADNAGSVPVTQTLSWSGGDPDGGNTVTYTVYWKLLTSGTYTQACANTSATSCDPSGDFGYSMAYNWYVVAVDNFGASSQNTPWTFLTMGVAVNNPPYTPNTPTPSDGATNVPITQTLSWIGGDPDGGNTVAYTVYWKLSTSGTYTQACANTSSTSCNPSGDFAYSSTYNWYVIATDNLGATSQNMPWSFTTGSVSNNPPYIPGNPNPATGSTNNSTTLTLQWTGSDPDPGDTVTYDVYYARPFSIYALVCDDVSITSCGPLNLSYDVQYNWKVIATDSHGLSAQGPSWTFRTKVNPNQPPYTPSSPNPASTATNVPVTQTLSWSGGDPDSGNTVTYTVYWKPSTSSTYTQACANASATSCNPSGDFGYGATYNWFVVATDNLGATSQNSPWSFTTTSTSIVPDINVVDLVTGIPIPDGDTTPSTADGTDFGNATVSGGSVSHEFRIRNPGTASLNLLGNPRVVVGGINAGDFTVSVQPTSPIGPYNNSTQFTVLFHPTAAGMRTATLTIENNDPDENPYNFTIQGFGVSTSSMSFRSVGAYDGWILESTETSLSGGTLNSTDTTFKLGDEAGDKQYRSILSFNTAGLPDNAVITRVMLRIRKQSVVGTDPFTILGGLKVDIRKPFFGLSVGLVASDFQAAASRANVGTFRIIPVNNWYTSVIGSTGYPYINKTGTTQFRLRFLIEDNDNMSADYLKFFSGNNTNALVRPMLIIYYTVP